MTRSAGDEQQALGAHGEAHRGPPPRAGGAWSLLDRNWRCDAGRDRPGAARRPTCWWSARSRPARRTAYGTPLEAVDRRKAGPAAPAGAPGGCDAHDVPAGRRPDRPGRRAAAAARARSRSSTSRGSADGRSRPPAPSSLQGAVGHLDRRPGRRLPGHGRHRRWSAGPTPRSTRRATGAGWRSSTAAARWPATQRVTILLSPADLPKRGTHFDLAIAVAVLAADGRGAGADALERHGVHRRADPRRAAAAGARACCRWSLAAAARGIDRVFVPEPQAARGGAGAGDGGLRGPLAGPGGRPSCSGDEVPEAPPVAAAVRRRAADLARRGPARGARPAPT